MSRGDEKYKIYKISKDSDVGDIMDEISQLDYSKINIHLNLFDSTEKILGELKLINITGDRIYIYNYPRSLITNNHINGHLFTDTFIVSNVVYERSDTPEVKIIEDTVKLQIILVTSEDREY